MKYYAIADLHGRYDLLTKATDAIFARETGRDFKIIFLGDYIDRGPQSKEIIEFLSQAQDIDPETYICLRGNHEDMAITVCSNPTFRMQNWWISNGGAATFKSYAIDGTVHEVDPAHVKWMANLPLYYETEKQVFVHAGIPNDRDSLEDQTKLVGYDGETLMNWLIYNPTDMGGYQGKHVVHGHVQSETNPQEWIGSKRGGRTDLDTWAYYTGRLVIGVFDDTQGPAKEFIEVKL